MSSLVEPSPRPANPRLADPQPANPQPADPQSADRQPGIPQRPAYLLIRADNLTAITCNEEYKRISLFPELLENGVEGHHLTEFVIGLAHLRAYHRIAAHGGVESGIDYLVGQDGVSRAYNWKITRPTPDVIATVIRCRGGY